MSTYFIQGLANSIQMQLFYKDYVKLIEQNALLRNGSKMSDSELRKKFASVLNVKETLEKTTERLGGLDAIKNLWDLKPPYYIYSAILVNWFAVSRRVYTLPAHLSQLFAVTDFQAKDSLEIFLPFPCFAIYLERGILYKDREYKTIIVFNGGMIGDCEETEMLFLLSTNFSKFCNTKAAEDMLQFGRRYDYYAQLMDGLDALDAPTFLFQREEGVSLKQVLRFSQVSLKELEKLSDGRFFSENKELFQLASRVVYNTLAFLQEERPDELVSVKSRPTKAFSTSKKPNVDIFEIQNIIELPYETTKVLDEAYKKRESTGLMAVHFVSSFYRRPPGGVKLGLPKTVFVHNHTRGQAKMLAGDTPRVTEGRLE